MTTEEQQKQNVIDNQIAQKEAMGNAHKLNSRFTALETSKQTITMGQDLLTEAEKIYQWLIKDL